MVCDCVHTERAVWSPSACEGNIPHASQVSEAEPPENDSKTTTSPKLPKEQQQHLSLFLKMHITFIFKIVFLKAACFSSTFEIRNIEISLITLEAHISEDHKAKWDLSFI